MLHCPSCGTPYELGDKFCTTCPMNFVDETSVTAVDQDATQAPPLDDTSVVEVVIGAIEEPTAGGSGIAPSAAEAESKPAPVGNADPLFIREGDDFAALSVRGFKWRNEDCVAIGRVTRAGKAAMYIVVADGVSSCKNGPGASAAACLAVDTFFKDSALSPEEPALSLVQVAVARAHEAVICVPAELDAPLEYSPPGTTIAVAYVEDGNVYVGWCGDSSVYLISDQSGARQARRITDPHNVLYGLMRLGLSREQALTECALDERHILERLLAPLPKGKKLEPSFATVSLADVVCLLVCSDGLADDVHPEETNDTSEVTALFEASDGNAEALVRLGISTASGEDNITCAAVLFNSKNDGATQ